MKSMPDIRDGDGDGMIYDGTEWERPAPSKVDADTPSKSADILEMLQNPRMAGIGLLAKTIGVDPKTTMVTDEDIERWIGDAYEDWWVMAGSIGDGKPMPFAKFVIKAQRWFNDQNIELRMSQAIERTEDASVILFEKPGDFGGKFIAHPSTRHPGKYQLTRMGELRDGSEVPFGHTEHSDRESAIAAAIGAHEDYMMNEGSSEYEIVWTDKDSSPPPKMRSLDAVLKSMPDIRDGDGDGMIYGGTEWERPAPPKKPKEKKEAAGKKKFNMPQKTIKAYKLFRTLKSRPGEIFPLFIGKTKPTPVGKWIPAEFLPTKGFADRPGWHAGVLPLAPHLRTEDNQIEGSRVWAEVEIPADVDWQSVADKRPKRDIRDEVPIGGHYRFKTSKMQGGAWIIGGAIKVNRILRDDEVAAVLKESGKEDQIKYETHGNDSVFQQFKSMSISDDLVVYDNDILTDLAESDALEFIDQEYDDTLPVEKSASKEPKDGDGDGFIYDGTPQERPAPPKTANEDGESDPDGQDDPQEQQDDDDSAEDESSGEVVAEAPAVSNAAAKIEDAVVNTEEDAIKLVKEWRDTYKAEPIERAENEYRPRVDLDLDGDGVADFAKVGVPAKDVPPPPAMIPRLPNLTPDERAVERSFAEFYEEQPDEVAARYREKLASGEIGDGPNVFATDEAKMLHPVYAGSTELRARYNVALHQTANAIAKRAFIQHLDEVVMALPENQRHVLVTAGGVAAGKGFCLANNEQTSSMAKMAAAVWDSAGEQNSTEMPWVMEELNKRGIKGTFVYVHANPEEKWENPKFGAVERAKKKGRMVDAHLFADSYAMGAKNFEKFWNKHDGDENHKFLFIDGTSAKPKMVERMPEGAVSLDRNALYRRSVSYLLGAKDVPNHIKRGGSVGMRVWGDKDLDDDKNPDE